MALPGNGTILATSAERKQLYRRAAQRIVAMVAEFDSHGAGHGLLPREIVTPRRVRQRDDPRHGHGRQHQHRAAHPGHRPRGGRALRHAAHRRAQPEHAQHLQGGPEQQATTSKTCTTPAASTRSWARSSAAGPGLLDLTARPSPARRWARTSPSTTSAARTASQEALELAAVTAGDQRGPCRAHERPAPGGARSASLTTRTSCGFDPLRLHPRGRQRLQPGGRPGDPLRQPGPQGRGGQDGRRRSPTMLRHSGPAVIFEGETDAYDGIVFGKVKAGDVVVIRYEGPQRRAGHAGNARPHHGHQGRGPGRQGGPDHRRPLLRRHGRGLHRPRQPRGGRRRPDRPVAAPATSSRSTSPAARSTCG